VVGASAWYETGPYDADFAAALRAAQEIALRSHADDVDAASVEELWQDEDWLEFVGTVGTGTVLDVCRLIGEDQPDAFATLRPMGAGEFRGLLGVWRRPTYADFVEGYATDKLPNPDSRGSARCAVLYRDEKPSQIVYWGLTAD
jgi:hypothetical protein